MSPGKTLSELAADAVAADLADRASRHRESRARRLLDDKIEELRRRLDNLQLQSLGHENRGRALERNIDRLSTRVDRIEDKIRAEIDAWAQKLYADLRDVTEP